MQESTFDTCVIGGGPAGLSAAYTLASANIKVVLVLEQKDVVENAGETLHSSAIDSICKMQLATEFGKLGLDTLAGFESSWGMPIPLFKPAIQMPGGGGWLFQRKSFEDMLLKQFLDRGGCVFYGPFEIKKKEKWCLTFTGCDFMLSTSFLIIATGRKGLSQFSMGPKQVIDKLICFTVRMPSSDCDLVVRLDAMETGWMYTAKQEEGFRGLSFFTDGDLFREREPDKIIGHLSDLLLAAPSIRKIIGSVKACSNLTITSANTTFLESSVGENWLACGDSAQTYDPLSSQGIAQALQSGIEAAQSVIESLSGSKVAQHFYELARRSRYREYLKQRNAYYSLEKRWTSVEFWSRRIQGTSISQL
jgi:flavin-dependent dehydrogenase